jgi:hypothetical protein
MPAEVVGKPNDGDGLENVDFSAHENDGHVPDVHAQAGLRVVWLCKRTLAEQDDISDAHKDYTEQDKAVPMAEPVREDRCSKCDDSSNNPDGMPWTCDSTPE